MWRLVWLCRWSWWVVYHSVSSGPRGSPAAVLGCIRGRDTPASHPWSSAACWSVQTHVGSYGGCPLNTSTATTGITTIIHLIIYFEWDFPTRVLRCYLTKGLQWTWVINVSTFSTVYTLNKRTKISNMFCITWVLLFKVSTVLHVILLHCTNSPVCLPLVQPIPLILFGPPAQPLSYSVVWCPYLFLWRWSELFGLLGGEGCRHVEC